MTSVSDRPESALTGGVGSPTGLSGKHRRNSDLISSFMPGYFASRYLAVVEAGFDEGEGLGFEFGGLHFPQFGGKCVTRGARDVASV